MNINFTEKELQVIQLMVPNMTPEDVINTVLRDWYRTNVKQFQIQTQSDDELTDAAIATHEANQNQVL